MVVQRDKGTIETGGLVGQRCKIIEVFMDDEASRLHNLLPDAMRRDCVALLIIDIEARGLARLTPR